MKKIFIGLFFVLLDFTFSLGQCTLGLIPDFVGYFLISKGVKELSEKSCYFSQAKPIVSGMMIYSIVTYLMDLFGISAKIGAFLLLFTLIAIAGCIYVSYLITLGVKDIEASSRLQLYGDTLFSRWKLFAGCQAASLVIAMIPFINIIFLLVCYVTIALYLIAFNNSKNAYRA